MKASRTVINLVTVIIASAVLVLFAVTQLLATAILDNNYPLFVELPEAGGLLENKQVTYRGVGVGEIVAVTLCGDDSRPDLPACAGVENVLVEMGVNNDIQIPKGIDVVVLRQSAVGEQALDIRPIIATGPQTEYYTEGEVLQPGSITLPTKPQNLLEVANRVFEPVDPDSAATLVRELAATVQGRSEDLQSIMVDSANLSQAVGDNGADFDRLFAASRIVNGSLARNRDALASLITDLADGAELIGDVRDEIDGLLDTAPPVLDATTSLLQRGDANLACNLRYLANLNTFTNLPENLANLEEGIRVNVFFFDAFRIIGPTSVQGDPWLRVQFIAEPAPVPLLYVPKRPIPATLPGGACESVFGPGAGSAVQPNHQLATPDGQVIRPENDRQTSFTQVASPGLAVAAGSAFEVDPNAVAVDTGGTGAAPVVGMIITFGAGLVAFAARSTRERIEAAAARRSRTGHDNG
ncbi:MAG: MlaD family protein [Euzebya sp.]